MADAAVVQEGAASAGAASAEGQTPQAPTFTAEQEAVIAAKVAEAAGSAEAVKRAFQSDKDKAIARAEKAERVAAQARREAEEARNLLGVYGKTINDLDPDAATKLQLASYQERDRFEATRKQAEAVERIDAEFAEEWRKSFDEEISESGVDPKDLDWAEELGNNYLARKTRVGKSIIKAMKGKARAMQESWTKEITAKVLKELGVNSADTAMSASSAGKRVYSMAELEDRKFVREHLEDIALAQREGRIKE